MHTIKNSRKLCDYEFTSVHFYQIVEQNRIEKSIRQRETNRI